MSVQWLNNDTNLFFLSHSLADLLLSHYTDFYRPKLKESLKKLSKWHYAPILADKCSIVILWDASLPMTQVFSMTEPGVLRGWRPSNKAQNSCPSLPRAGLRGMATGSSGQSASTLVCSHQKGDLTTLCLAPHQTNLPWQTLHQDKLAVNCGI